MQVFMVTGLYAGQHNTELHGTIRDVIAIVLLFKFPSIKLRPDRYNNKSKKKWNLG